LEVSILEAGMELRGQGVPEFHGFALARAIQDRAQARLLTAYGTLYKALDRMERAGLLTSRWEDPLVAAEDGRPRRRLYHVTLAGARGLAAAQEARSEHGLGVLPRGAADGAPA
jgi:DNA-binding PadR family transcriptional regulator